MPSESQLMSSCQVLPPQLWQSIISFLHVCCPSLSEISSRQQYFRNLIDNNDRLSICARAYLHMADDVFLDEAESDTDSGGENDVEIVEEQEYLLLEIKKKTLCGRLWLQSKRWPVYQERKE